MPHVKSVKVIEAIQRKSYTHKRIKYTYTPEMVGGKPKFNAIFSDDKVTLYGWLDRHDRRAPGTHEAQYRRTFALGDEVIYGSYNLIYTGKITKITEKKITIVAYHGTRNSEKHNLDLYSFATRNYQLDLNFIEEHNARVSQEI